jgi:YhcH/YjgK/YiaL family protein
MILDTLDHAQQYENISKGLKQTLLTLENWQTEPYVTGRTDVQGEQLYLLANAYATKSLGEESRLEVHRSYIDVMYMVEGEELIYVKPTEQLRQVDKLYDPAIDAMLAKLDGDETAVRLQKGQFLVLFPQDAHCPGNRSGNCDSVKKIICKLKLGW